ncbi:MAG: 16S rRNA (guanine(966)-N(2))-methyltransferase RsmD [Hyphomonadaceae bacterium]|nr:16S rRNA (guanine(966)-N(2))-methyltransferase RsmD [Hyphomonadaceae bacterium]
MRIVGGQYRGRPLAAPGDDRTRPTSDRVREAVFNILAHGVADFTLEDVRVLDLFAGTGALGIEALSRGAAYCLFVEEDAQARGTIRRNIETCGLTGITKIFRRDAADLGPAGNRGTFGLVFLDPPYGKGLAERALGAAAAGGWLAPAAIAVIEERKGAVIALPAPFAAIDQRAWGDTQVLFARSSASQA